MSIFFCAARWLALAALMTVSVIVSADEGTPETSPPHAASSTLRVMSFNIRFGTAKDGDNHWDHRHGLVVQTIRDFDPDLLGTQETLQFQADYLKEQLKQYSYFGRSRMKTPNEHCGIFYRTERFTKLASGHFWLSETPELPESKSWDSSLPRMVSWVLLNDHQYERGRPILFLNTHFDHRGSEARLQAAQLIQQRLERLQRIAENPIVVVTGDFNTGENSAPYTTLLTDPEQLVDTYRVAHPQMSDNEGTFGGWRGNTSGARIDWILASPDVRVTDAQIIRFSQDGRYPSDHYPVTATLQVRGNNEASEPPPIE